MEVLMSVIHNYWVAIAVALGAIGYGLYIIGRREMDQLDTPKKAYKDYERSQTIFSFNRYDNAAKELFDTLTRIVDSGGTVCLVFDDGPDVEINSGGWITAENISRARWLDINGYYGGYEMAHVKEIKC